MDGATEKHHAHELIERLPDSQIVTAVRALLISGAWRRSSKVEALLDYVACANPNSELS
jgi:hypothetical protein